MARWQFNFLDFHVQIYSRLHEFPCESLLMNTVQMRRFISLFVQSLTIPFWIEVHFFFFFFRTEIFRTEFANRCTS